METSAQVVDARERGEEEEEEEEEAKLLCATHLGDLHLHNAQTQRYFQEFLELSLIKDQPSFEGCKRI